LSRSIVHAVAHCEPNHFAFGEAYAQPHAQTYVANDMDPDVLAITESHKATNVVHFDPDDWRSLLQTIQVANQEAHHADEVAIASPVCSTDKVASLPDVDGDLRCALWHDIHG
jgi:hypothetical protein